MAGVTRAVAGAWTGVDSSGTSSASVSYPTYNSEGSSPFIPQVWSKKMLRNFYETTAFLEIANTD